ncbi:MAG: PD40 domain-containing protein [Lentisphaerae bacterium]|nr:PD40 domain-containing protein [Lentisphaerota bacterium]
MPSTRHFSVLPAFLGLAFSLCLPAVRDSSAQGVAPIHSGLKRTESENFVYIFQESLAERMPRFVKTCEDAHEVLCPIFKWTPKEKTVVMYFDAEDVHNGWATAFPRPTVMIIAADIPPNTTIYEPGDYIRRTFFHEFTHILEMDAQDGVDGFFSSVFGHVFPPFAGDPVSLMLMFLTLSPGAVAPSWFLEGTSIWTETEMVGPGRGRSTTVDMIMRMAVKDKRLLTPSKWFLEYPEWPHGAAAYLYGAELGKYIHDTYSLPDGSRNVPGEVVDSVSKGFPYIVNSRPKRATGKTFMAMATAARKRIKERQAERIAQLESVPLSVVSRITPERLIVSRPRFGPDGEWIYFAGEAETGRDSLYRVHSDKGTLDKLGSARTTASVLSDMSPDANRKSMLYTRLQVHGRDRVRYEIRRLDTRTRRTRSVTRQGRYRYVAQSPDGTALAAVVNRAGMQSLVLVPMDRAGEEEAETVLFAAPPLHALVHPVFSPDGEHVVFVESNEKISRLRRSDTSEGPTDVLLEWPGLVLAPVFHPSGEAIVFSADKNGVYNLYRMPPKAEAKPDCLTHVLGGVFEPDFSPDGTRLAAVAYDSYGFYLTVLDYATLTPPEKDLPVLEERWKSLPSNVAKKKEVEDRPLPELGRISNYNSLLATRLDYWFPWLTFGSIGGLQGGLGALFTDPTGYQVLQVLAGYDTGLGIPVGTVVYQYSGTYPIIAAYGGQGAQFYPDMVKDDGDLYYVYGEKAGTVGLSVGVPLLKVDWNTSATFGYQYDGRSGIAAVSDVYAGTNVVSDTPFEGGEGSLWAQLSFLNATAFSRSHSLESGRSVGLAASWSDSSILGGGLSRTRLRADWAEFITMPWGENHVLKIEGVYAVGSGDETPQGLFGLGQDFSVMNDLPGLPSGIGVRGYPANTQVGTEAVKAGVSYRFPLIHAYGAIHPTTPLYFHQFFGEIFYEGGRATGSEAPGSPANGWLNAAGVEVNLSTTFLRLLQIAPGMGIVYAPDQPTLRRHADTPAGEPLGTAPTIQAYLTIKSTVNF